MRLLRELFVVIVGSLVLICACHPLARAQREPSPSPTPYLGILHVLEGSVESTAGQVRVLAVSVLRNRTSAMQPREEADYVLSHLGEKLEGFQVAAISVNVPQDDSWRSWGFAYVRKDDGSWRILDAHNSADHVLIDNINKAGLWR